MLSSTYHIWIQIDKNLSPEDQAPGHAYIPKSLLDSLPSHSEAQLSKRHGSYRRKGHKDYRYGPIQVEWVDFEALSDANTDTQAPGEMLNRPEERQTPVAMFVPNTSSKSGTTNLCEGVVHIFRERFSTTSQLAASNLATCPSTSPRHPDEPDSEVSFEKDTTIVAVLAVPSWMTPSDFLAFIAPAAEGMKHLRLIRDISPNRTMAVMQFREASSATEFIEEFGGKQFNSIEPETCNVVRVKSIELDEDDPMSLISNPHTTVYELPTCPVCLDRMDASATGLVTVPCSHTFHCMCLSKWGDSRCPVCRYSQIALSSHSQPSGTTYVSSPADTRLASCTECNSRFNLWICLICGNVGCGRQGRAHAKGHYEFTSHRYAMDLATQRVWDYAGDNYVHRLIQNKADGKLVELPSASASEDIPEGARARSSGRVGEGPGDEDNLKAEKVEILAMQYSQILQRAMEEQRAAHALEAAELQRNLDDAMQRLEIAHVGAVAREREIRAALKDDAERVAQLERDRARADKRAEKMSELARKFEKELHEERTVSEGMMDNLSNLKEKISVFEKEKSELASRIGDLEEQLRDLMFYLEAREKIEKGDGVVSEAAGGSIEIQQSESYRTGGSGKKGKKKK